MIITNFLAAMSDEESLSNEEPMEVDEQMEVEDYVNIDENDYGELEQPVGEKKLPKMLYMETHQIKLLFHQKMEADTLQHRLVNQ